MRTELLLLLFLGLSAGSSLAQPLPQDAASLASGKTLYQFHCAFCHGKGDDGMAANLVSANLVHAPTDTALLDVIRAGIPSGGMPPALGMNPTEMRQLAGYVRSLGRSAPTTVPGDAVAGKALYEGKGRCSNCHMIAGDGGYSGPDLSLIGATRSPSNLRASIVEPNAALAAGWTMVRATLKSGPAVSGIRLNEDNFYLHLRESNGQIRSIAKADTSKISRDLTRSSMPSYKTMFTPQELDNLVAYLFTLKGKN
jgi:cytochrome c oxidase cbb3-type subunit III